MSCERVTRRSSNCQKRLFSRLERHKGKSTSKKFFFHQSRARAKATSTLLRRTRQSRLAAACRSRSGRNANSPDDCACWPLHPALAARFPPSVPPSHKVTHDGYPGCRDVRQGDAGAHSPARAEPGHALSGIVFISRGFSTERRPKSPPEWTRERVAREGTRARRARRTGTPRGRSARVPRSRFPPRASRARRGAGSGGNFG